MPRKNGRPTKYNKKMIDKVYQYIEENQDKYYEFHKTRGDRSDSYERHIKVNLPTVEGYAKYVGVDKTTVYDWKKKYLDFSHALEEINAEQKKRLIECSLSGDYNANIAKLILSANFDISEKKKLDVDASINMNIKDLSDDELLEYIQGNRGQA